jgi:hypothetical protein
VVGVASALPTTPPPATTIVAGAANANANTCNAKNANANARDALADFERLLEHVVGRLSPEYVNIK